MEYTASSAISLISHIHSVAADYLQLQLGGEGLSSLVSSHGFILFCLSKTDMLPLGELAEKINRDKSTTTVLVRKLEQASLVAIDRGKNDSRKKYVRLTEHGRAYNQAVSRISADLLDTCYAGFSANEKETLTSLLQRVHINIQNGLAKTGQE